MTCRFFTPTLVVSFVIWALLAYFNTCGQRALFVYPNGSYRCDYWAPRITAEIGYSAKPEPSLVAAVSCAWPFANKEMLVVRRDRCYPAAATVPLKLFPLTQIGGWTSTILGACIYLLSLCYAKRSAVPLLFVFTAPFLFNLDLGNLIWIAAAATSVFLADYRSPNPKRRYVAAVALGIAVSFKLSPILLGIAYLPEIFDSLRHGRREVVIAPLVAASVALMLLVLPFAFMPDGFSGIRDMLANAAENGRYYAVRAALGLGVIARTALIGMGKSWLTHGNAIVALQHVSQLLGAIVMIIGTRRRDVFLVAGGFVFAVPNMMYYGLLYLLPFLPLPFFGQLPKDGFCRWTDILPYVPSLVILCPLQLAVPAGSEYLSANVLICNFVLMAQLLIRLRHREIPVTTRAG